MSEGVSSCFDGLPIVTLESAERLRRFLLRKLDDNGLDSASKLYFRVDPGVDLPQTKRLLSD